MQQEAEYWVKLQHVLSCKAIKKLNIEAAYQLSQVKETYP